MKKINFVKFTLDLAMGIVFALLFNKNVLGGISFHEIAGLAIGFGVLVHIVLNWKWVKNVTKAIFSKNIAIKTRIGYVLNILLLLDMAVIIIIGIFISKSLFPGLRMQNSFFNQGTHISASYIALALIGIHLGLHWNRVMNVFKKIVKVILEKKIFGHAAKAAAALVLAFGIYGMVSSNFLSSTAMIFEAGRQMPFEQNKGARSDFQFQGSDMQQSKDFPQYMKDIKGGKHGFDDGEEGMMVGNGRGSVNIPRLLASILSIMGAFSVLTYYLEKLLSRRRTA